MPPKKVNGKKNRLVVNPQSTMERIISARQRAFASDKPCHTPQSVRERVDALSKRLADPEDVTARDDALLFLSYRYSSLPAQLILQLKTDLKYQEEREQELADQAPDLSIESYYDSPPPDNANVVNFTDHMNADLLGMEKGEEPLWYKIYIHSELRHYAQVN